MRIAFRDISLQWVSERNLETLRNVRNRASELGFMLDNRYISESMQQRWFDSLDAMQNYYFIVYSNDILVGAAHLTEVDIEKGEAESGLYLIQPDYKGTHVAVLSSLLLLYMAFNLFQLDYLKAKVLLSNTIALRYNAALGFKYGEHINKSSIWMLMHSQDYFHHVHMLFEKLAAGQQFSCYLDEDAMLTPLHHSLRLKARQNAELVLWNNKK